MKRLSAFMNKCVTGALPNEPIRVIHNWSAWRSAEPHCSWATCDKWLDTTWRADLHTTRRGKKKNRTNAEEKKIYAAEVKPHLVWWAMLNNNRTGGQLPWLECLGERWRGGLCPPYPTAVEAKHSLACMLLQGWPKQSMLSTLFISKQRQMAMRRRYWLAIAF